MNDKKMYRIHLEFDYFCSIHDAASIAESVALGWECIPRGTGVVRSIVLQTPEES